jgi:hypothetical protein
MIEFPGDATLTLAAAANVPIWWSLFAGQWRIPVSCAAGLMCAVTAVAYVLDGSMLPAGIWAALIAVWVYVVRIRYKTLAMRAEYEEVGEYERQLLARVRRWSARQSKVDR